MEHSPEERADDRKPPPLLLEPEIAAFSSISPHYNEDHLPPKIDLHVKREKKPSISSSVDSDDDFFLLEPTVLGGPSPPGFEDPPVGLVPHTPSEPRIAPGDEISLSAKHFGDKRPPTPARTDVPDPNRIPASIFARNPAASQMEWSVASNESLFSIQMGNSSFSREHGLFLLGRSGELGNIAAGPWDYPPPRPAAPREALEDAGVVGTPVDVDEVVEERGKEEKEAAAAAEEEEVEEKEGMLEAEGKEVVKAAGDPLGHSISRHSDGSSTASLRSFAFPVLSSDEKNESIKFRLPQAVEHQPPPTIEPPKASCPTPAANTASPPAPTLTSAKCSWFPCFS